jgi:hypothetical protein
MFDRQTILQHLRPFENRRDILVHDQDVSDIITGILNTHQLYKSEYDKIAPYFVGSNNYQTGKNIWNFLKKNVRYKVEPESAQMLKSPAAIITGTVNGRTNTSDCKNYSLFTGGILDAINRAGGRIDWCYRFASYKVWDKIPQHVFCVINPDTNKEIWVDAVLPTYDNKKGYYYKTDKKVNNMALVALAGTMAGKKERQQKKAAKKQTKAEKKATNKEKRKKFFQKVKAAAKKAGKLVLKYNPATATARNAFLALTRLNVRSLATSLQRLKNKGNNEVQTMWTKLGGNVTALNSAIDAGAKKKRLGAIGVVVKESRFTTATANPKETRFTTPATGGRLTSLATKKIVRMPTAPTETILQTFLPTPVPVIQTQYPTGGGYSGGGGGGAYSDENYQTDEFAEETTTDTDVEGVFEQMDNEGNIVGVVVSASTAAAIAAAAPIVAMVVKILSRHKDVANSTDLTGVVSDVENAGEQEAAAALEDIEKESQGIETERGNKMLQGATQSASAKKGAFPIMPVALIGAGVLAFTLLKKK